MRRPQRSTPRRLASLVGVLVPLATALPAFAEEAPPAGVDERIAKGEVVVELSNIKGYSQPAMRFSAVIDAKPDDVFALVDDCGHYPDWIPHVASARETSRDGESSVCTWVVALPFPLKNVSTEVAVTRTRAQGKLTREFAQTHGEFLRHEGTWTLTPFRGDPAKTRIEYRLFVAMDTVLPDSFVTSGQRRGVLDMVKNMRAKLEKHPAP